LKNRGRNTNTWEVKATPIDRKTLQSPFTLKEREGISEERMEERPQKKKGERRSKVANWERTPSLN